MALEYAGFEVRGQRQHWFGSGFPKSLNVSKAIDAQLGAEREVVGVRPIHYPDSPSGYGSVSAKGGIRDGGMFAESTGDVQAGRLVTAAATEAAKQWSGYGTALKPSFEIWWLVRKPLERGLTVAENVLKWGTGALNIDACRVAHSGAADLAAHVAQVEAIKARGGSMDNSWKNSSDLSGANDVSVAGRWPPDLVFTHDHRCVRRGTAEVGWAGTWDTPNRATEPSAFTGSEVSKVRHANGRDGEASAEKRYADKGATNFAPLPGARREDTESVDVFDCVDGCPVRELELQSGTRTRGAMHEVMCGGLGSSNGTTHGERAKIPYSRESETGTAARYFPQFEWTELDDISSFHYAPKPARSERDAGLEHFRPRSAGEATDREDDTAALGSPRSGAGRNGGVRNVHPTVKGEQFLGDACRLITPPGGIVITPFAGSGSEGRAAILCGFRFIGIELNDSDEDPSVSTARARILHVEGRSYVPRESLRAKDPPRQTSMFTVDEGGT